jgi:hypothetical protein
MFTSHLLTNGTIGETTIETVVPKPAKSNFRDTSLPLKT